ncbi:MAG: DUF2520 domain-containing protein [Bdellovibrionota bacterium]
MPTKPAVLQTAVLLIGSGRLAQHLQHWNKLLENPNQLICWNRSQDLELLKNSLSKCSIVWLAISDSAIQSFYDEHLRDSKLKVVHFSGALDDKRFLSAHPLMSFPHSLLTDDVYKKIHFVISGFENLGEALPGLNNAFTILNSEKKAYYHALCVLAGNFPQLIWNEVSLKMKELNLPAEASDLYIKQITENYLNLKEKAITGPLVRKDYVTIEKNITSLTETTALKNIYTAFTKEFNQ